MGGVGQVMTRVVAAVATTVMTVRGVGPATVLLVMLLPAPPVGSDTHGPVTVFHELGGPLTTAGQGGRARVLPMATPLPLVTVTTGAGMGTLGVGLKPPDWPARTTMLDCCMTWVVMGAMTTVMVVVVTTKDPPAEEPTSREVV